jgi:hypothetical protein
MEKRTPEENHKEVSRLFYELKTLSFERDDKAEKLSTLLSDLLSLFEGSTQEKFFVEIQAEFSHFHKCKAKREKRDFYNTALYEIDHYLGDIKRYMDKKFSS